MKQTLLILFAALLAVNVYSQNNQITEVKNGPVGTTTNTKGNTQFEQIFVHVSPDASDEQKLEAKKKIDGLYSKLNAGENFEELAKDYSEDITSAKDGGKLPDLDINKTSSEFEEVALSLKNIGDYSMPVLSKMGWHIIKLIDTNPVNSSSIKNTSNDNLTQMIGQQAPELLLRDENMNVVSISQIKTPYVILFFWDPICPPCTKLIPRLDSLYENYLKKMGCEVVGINLRTNKDEWMNFITKHKLGWINVWDPNNETGFEQKYEIANTPMMYILDKDKKVISKTRNIEDVKYILDEVVSKEDNNGSESRMNDDNKGKETEGINAELPQLQAYPNPFNNGFTIYLPEFSNKISISLVSMEGRQVFEGAYEASNSTHYVDVSSQNLAAGTYIVTAQTDKRTYSCKLVKQ